jgi:hypothetical protein
MVAVMATGQLEDSVSDEAEMTAEVTPRLSRRRVFSLRLGLGLSIALVIVTVAMLPFALISIGESIHTGGASRSYELWSPASESGEWTNLNLSAVDLDEVNKEITFQVTGFHDCTARCTQDERVQFFSIAGDPARSLGPPPSDEITLPKNSGEVDTQVTLPVSGDLTDYPFDKYRLVLGVAFSSVSASGVQTPIRLAQARHELAFSVDDEVSRTTLSQPVTSVPRGYDTTGLSYDAVVSLTFHRPTYLWIVTVLLILLIMLAEAYAVLLRPFDQIIPTIGGLVLGVWGVRSLLVGSYPPDSTGVDLVLEATILLLLLVFAIRAAHYMWHAGQRAQLSGRSPAGS